MQLATRIGSLSPKRGRGRDTVTVSRSGLQHSNLLRVFENPTGLEDWCDFAEALQFPLVAGRLVRERFVCQVDRQLVAGADLVDEPFLRFDGHKIAAVHGVAI